MCIGRKLTEFKINFISIKFLHAHLPYVCNIRAKYQMDTQKAVGGVDFTVCSIKLLTIIQYVHWSKYLYMKCFKMLSICQNAYIVLNSFMCIYNMSINNWKDPLRAERGEIDFTGYAQSIIILYMRW